jgi:hypothetical protein
MLAVRTRSKGVVQADVERALTVDRSLVITWLVRGTLQLVRSQDYQWPLQLTAPRLTAAANRWLAHQGMSAQPAERAVKRAPWPSWLDAIWLVMGQPPTAIWLSGRAYRFAKRELVSRALAQPSRKATEACWNCKVKVLQLRCPAPNC